MKERQRQLLATAQAGAEFWTARVGVGAEGSTAYDDNQKGLLC